MNLKRLVSGYNCEIDQVLDNGIRVRFENYYDFTEVFNRCRRCKAVKFETNLNCMSICVWNKADYEERKERIRKVRLLDDRFWEVYHDTRDQSIARKKQFVLACAIGAMREYNSIYYGV